MQNDDTQAIDDIAKALKQIVSCNPQLLYKAAQKCTSDFLIDSMAEELQPQPKAKKVDALKFRGGLCLWLSRLLLQSGRAHLDTDDVTNMAMYLRATRDDTAQS